MSGLEIASLTLAAFDIITSSLSKLPESLETIRIWRGYRRELDSYQIRLETQSVIYRNTLEILLDGIVPRSARSQLLQERSAPIWQRPEYRINLRTRLDHSYDVYLKIVNRMLEDLDELKNQLDIDQLEKTTLEDYAFIERTTLRTELAISKPFYEGLISRIERANKDLDLITRQSRDLDFTRREQRIWDRVQDLKKLRQLAKSLFNSIFSDTLWKCECRETHVVNLRLEPRFCGLHKTQTPLEFYILFLSNLPPAMRASSYQLSLWTWQEIQVRLTETKSLAPIIPRAKILSRGGQETCTSETLQSSATGSMNALRPATSSGQFQMEARIGGPVTDLCRTLHQMNGFRDYIPHQRFSFFQDKSSDTHRCDIFFPNDPVPRAFKTCSLESLFNIQLQLHNRGTHQRGILSHGDRLSIAATLASNIPQIDGSWIKRHIRSRDIFVTRPKGESGSQNKHFHNYLHCRLSLMDGICSTTNPSYSTSLEASQIRSRILYALGIILIELCFGQTIGSLREPEDEVQGNEILTDLNTAKRLVSSKDILCEYGDRYNNVVQRCLHCPFDVPELGFEDDDFQRNVFTEIVIPLLEEWKSFNGIQSDI